MAKAVRKRVKEVTQQMLDASRKPLTPQERAVFDRMSGPEHREWQRAEELGPVTILESLVEKGWADGTHSVPDGCEVYQRTHSLD